MKYQDVQGLVGILQFFYSDILLFVSCRTNFDVKLIVILPFLVTLNKIVFKQL